VGWGAGETSAAECAVEGVGTIEQLEWSAPVRGLEVGAAVTHAHSLLAIAIVVAIARALALAIAIAIAIAIARAIAIRIAILLLV
jgi:hypothetical protein